MISCNRMRLSVNCSIAVLSQMFMSLRFFFIFNFDIMKMVLERQQGTVDNNSNPSHGNTFLQCNHSKKI